MRGKHKGVSWSILSTAIFLTITQTLFTIFYSRSVFGMEIVKCLIISVSNSQLFDAGIRYKSLIKASLVINSDDVIHEFGI